VYLAFLFLLRNGTLIKRNGKGEKKKQIRGILCELLLHGPGKFKGAISEPIDLKAALWKFSRQACNKRLVRNMLLEMNNELDDRARPIIHKLSKELGVQIDAFETLGDVEIQNNNNGRAQHPHNDIEIPNDIQAIMEEPKMDRQLDGNTEKGSMKPNVLKGEELDLGFIPFVTNDEVSNDIDISDIQEVLMMTNDLEFLAECLGSEGFERNPYEAIFEEIYGDNDIMSPRKSPRKEPSFLNIDFLPLILEIEEEKWEGDAMSNPYDFEVDYEVVIDPHIKNQISGILRTHAEERTRVELITEDGNFLDLGEMVLPAAKFYTDWELKKVKLLHSIAEMGDIREVPLLNEMLDEEENESIAYLINEIIFKFLSEYPLDIDEEEQDTNIVDFGEHYVFNHLFGSLDGESQLLFLQEMEQIGDLSDLFFLETLHHHKDKVIADKAKSVSLYIAAKFGWLSTGGTENLSNHNLDLKKAIDKPQKLHLDPSTTLGVTPSGLDIEASGGKTRKKDKATSMDPSYRSPDLADETFYNDLFEIDFDITRSEPISLYNSGSNKKKDNLEEMEALNFLEQLKALTSRIFKK
jgi:hypothetical protein